MKPFLRVCIVLLIACLVPGCFIVSVADGTTGAILEGATVEVQNCSGCPTYTRTTGHDPGYPGLAYWDSYASDWPVTAERGSGVRVKVSKPGYQTRELYIWPDYQVDSASGKQYDITEVELFPLGPDSDGDGLLDVHEQRIGTNPWSRDTDNDGISDKAEVDGYAWVDYKALGANPRRRDVFVEIDYEQYDDQGVTRTARPADLSIAKLQEVYAALPIANPDGSMGIDVHVLLDDQLPRGTDCAQYVTTDRFDPIHRAGFRYGMFCIAPLGGQGMLWGQRFVGGVQHNTNPADDDVEYSHFYQFATMAHELGHNLGLHHGGDVETNCKPNYPSLMNYAYALGFNGTSGRLRDSQLQFSTGALRNYPLDENRLLETGSFPGRTPQDIAFIGDLFNVSGTAVDWNEDFMFQISPVKANITGWCAGDKTFDVLRDHDDRTILEPSLRGTLPGVGLAQAYSISGSPVVCEFPTP
ncbi:MAG: hypothetical protein ACTHU0_31045 [Kofleriaceae bacterium]